MLRILFGETNNVLYGPAWFKFNYESKWLSDTFVKEMMQDVDKSSYVSGEYIESEVLGPISPRDLSGGLKTLISIYENPDLLFDATSCGGNCAKWLIEMSKEKDYTINLKYLMKFKDFEPFEIYIVNEDLVVNSNREYVSKAIKYA